MATSRDTADGRDTADAGATILAAAISVLQDQGAPALTVRNVAAAAGCSTTGVYTHFGGKQGLVDAIFMEGFDGFKEALATADASMEDLAATYRSWAHHHPTHYLIMFGRAVPEYRPSHAALERAGLAFEVLVDHVAADGRRADPRQDAFHIWATVHGYVMLEMLNMFPEDLGTPEQLFQAGLAHLFNGETRNQKLP